MDFPESGFAQLPDDIYRKAYDGNTDGWASELGERAGRASCASELRKRAAQASRASELRELAEYLDAR